MTESVFSFFSEYKCGEKAIEDKCLLCLSQLIILLVCLFFILDDKSDMFSLDEPSLLAKMVLAH